MKKKLALVVVHEIYGVNDHMHHVTHHFTSSHIDVFCPNLLQSQPAFPYSDEEKAYHFFMNHIGFEDGKSKLKHSLPIFLVVTHILDLSALVLVLPSHGYVVTIQKWILLSDVTVLVYVTIFI